MDTTGSKGSWACSGNCVLVQSLRFTKCLAMKKASRILCAEVELPGFDYLSAAWNKFDDIVNKWKSS